VKQLTDTFGNLSPSAVLLLPNADKQVKIIQPTETRQHSLCNKGVKVLLKNVCIFHS